jgi:hypothetical protein
LMFSCPRTSADNALAEHRQARQRDRTGRDGHADRPPGQRVGGQEVPPLPRHPRSAARRRGAISSLRCARAVCRAAAARRPSRSGTPPRAAPRGPAARPRPGPRSPACDPQVEMQAHDLRQRFEGAADLSFLRRAVHRGNAQQQRGRGWRSYRRGRRAGRAAAGVFAMRVVVACAWVVMGVVVGARHRA